MRNEYTTYRYTRVLTDIQDLAAQLDQLQAAGFGTIFREKMPGAYAERPQLKKQLASLSPGDVVVVPAVDRLSRDTPNAATVVVVANRER